MTHCHFWLCFTRDSLTFERSNCFKGLDVCAAFCKETKNIWLTIIWLCFTRDSSIFDSCVCATFWKESYHSELHVRHILPIFDLFVRDSLIFDSFFWTSACYELDYYELCYRNTTNVTRSCVSQHASLIWATVCAVYCSVLQWDRGISMSKARCDAKKTYNLISPTEATPYLLTWERETWKSHIKGLFAEYSLFYWALLQKTPYLQRPSRRHFPVWIDS